MGSVVHVTIRFVPGNDTFTLLRDARFRLGDYGWTDVGIDSGPIGKITTVEDRDVVFSLNGKPGASDGVASDDVKAALKNTGAWAHAISQATTQVQQAIQDESDAVSSSAANAALAPAKAAAKGAIIVGCVALGGVLLTVYFVMRAQRG